LGAVILFLPALGLILLPKLYQKLELLVKIVIGLMILGFVGTLLIVGIRTDEVAPGLIPNFPDQASIFLALGMASTTFSIAAAAYQSYLMKEKNWGPEQLGDEGLDTIFGIAILGTISVVVLLTSAGVIAGTGESGFSAQAMALQLQPLVGPAAFYLFMCGFFFASFSSLVVNPLIGATLLADGLGKDPTMDSRPVKLWTAVAMLLGTGVVVVFGESPIELLRTAQALAVVAFPVLGFLVLSLAGDREIMGEHRSGLVLWIIGILGYLTILAIVFNYLRQLIQAF